ncbi:MAG TPA: prolipoprotein diacylglyceryl transferase [Ohtaekwangia sp.]
MNASAALSFIIWDVNPEIFNIPLLNHPVRWYGLSWALGFIISQQIMYFIYKKENRPAKEIDDLTLYLIIACILGARLGHVLFYDPVHYFNNPWLIPAVWEGGLASHGGGIGLLVGIYLFTRKTKVNFLWIADRLTIVCALTGALIRLGNLMNSEMIGIPTHLPWGFIFTLVDDIPRHPAQLYEAIHYFILFIVLFRLWYTRREKFQNGFLTGWFFIILFTIRFVDEFFKINQSEFENEMLLNMGQLLSIPFILAGIAILIYNRKQKKVLPESEPDQL